MKVNGSDFMAFTNAGGGEDLKSVAFATSHTLDLSMATTDTSTKDDGNGIWSNSEAGLLSWSVQTNNLLSDSKKNGVSFNELIDAMIRREPIKVALGLQGNQKDYKAKEEAGFNVPEGGWTPDTSNHYWGMALVTSLNVTGNNGEKATATATFTGCGPLKKVGGGILSLAEAASINAAQNAKAVETATIKK